MTTPNVPGRVARRPGERARRALAAAIPAVVIALGVGSIAVARKRVFETVMLAKRDPDVYGLPAPSHAIVMSLGYRSALADFLYASARVAFGIHVSEKRRFLFAGDYLDIVTTLDPKFREPYLFADTFLTLQAARARDEDFRRARSLLERGMEQLPFDQRIWFTAGQYMAYLAAPHMPPDEREEWRVSGGRALSRACELAGENNNIPYHCITAASLLSRAGEREAVIQMLTRTLAVTDDDEIRRLALGYLEVQLGERQRETREARLRAFDQAWKADLPFVSPDMLLLLGPKVDTARCAAVLDAAWDPSGGCATSWAAWARGAPEVLESLGPVTP